MNTIMNDTRENFKYLFTITSFLCDREPVIKYMNDKIHEDFAEIISMLTSILSRENISDYGINGESFDYQNMYTSDESGILDRLDEEEEQKKGKKSKRKK